MHLLEYINLAQCSHLHTFPLCAHIQRQTVVASFRQEVIKQRGNTNRRTGTSQPALL